MQMTCQFSRPLPEILEGKKVLSLVSGNPQRKESLITCCRKSFKKRKSSHLLLEILQEKKAFRLWQMFKFIPWFKQVQAAE
jgi:hypothetical protein